MKHLLYFFTALLAALFVSSCIEDGITTSPSDQPVFSVDTLAMGEVYRGQVTPTAKFVVYNRHDKILNISSIRLRDESGETFRINVDGTSGRSFSNIEIRPNDSIFVMVEATVPRGEGVLLARGFVDFVTNGVPSCVVLEATGIDVEVLRDVVISEDTQWDDRIPRQIFGALEIAEGATLTLNPGAQLLFHAGASMEVKGRLVTRGTPEAPVVLTGDRRDNVVADIPFDLMSGQWRGLTFHRTSGGSHLSHTVIKNMTEGVMADSVESVNGKGIILENCRIRNSDSYSFMSWFSDIDAVGCEFSDAALTPLLLCGGRIDMTHVTVANYFLFKAIQYPAVTLTHYSEKTRQPDVTLPLMSARFTNCVFYGLGDDFNAGLLDDTDVWVYRCLFKSNGTDDDHFVECVWNEDPLYYTVRNEYIFDYRLKPESPARGRGIPVSSQGAVTVDFYGVPRVLDAPSLGAFEITEEAEAETLGKKR